MIDLHCHSNFSDGGHSPAELLVLAAEGGVKTLALTDHDTVSGVEEIRGLAGNHAIEIINGIELSAKWKKYDLHILGLGIDIFHRGLQELIRQHRESRISRAEIMGERLAAATGLQHTFERAGEIAGHDSIGRPHFAAVLLEAGKVTTLQEAFVRYLGKHRVAYVPGMWQPLEEIISVITAAGGVAVLAHPFKYRLTRMKLHELIRIFRESGGYGLEVVSGYTTPGEALELAGLCRKFDLYASTGSDFHMAGVSRVAPGRQLALPDDCVPVWQGW